VKEVMALVEQYSHPEFTAALRPGLGV
jgi:hypothetical protein